MATDAFRKSPGPPFHDCLNQGLEAAGFDRFVESGCARFAAARTGPPSVAPGRCFRMLFSGFSEGPESERGIAWKGDDSKRRRRFLRFRGGPTDTRTLHALAVRPPGVSP